MRVCGVEVKGKEVMICLLSESKGLFDIPDCRLRRLAIVDSSNSEQLRRFQFTFAKLMADYKVEKVAIRERPTKGKFAGGAVGFKLEAAIQLAEGFVVELMSPNVIKKRLSQNPLPIRFKDTGLAAFQEVAFNTAYASLMPEGEELQS